LSGKKPEEAESTNQTKQSSVSKFLQVSMREGRIRTPENLVLAKLWRAGAANKLTRVISLVEAAWNAELVWPDKFKPDAEQLNILHNVAHSLSETRPSKISFNGYRYENRYSIPWAFSESAENFEKYIKPWLTGIPQYYTNLVFNIEDYREYKTRFLCPYCNAELLTFSEKDKTAEDFLENYEQTEIKTSPRKLANPKKLERCKFERILDSYGGFYDMPTSSVLNTTHCKCPKCEKVILIEQWTEQGTFPTDPERVEKLKRLTAEYKWLKIEHVNQLPESVRISHFYSVAKALTLTGFLTLKNQFIAWSNPIVSKLEMLISQHIPKKMWNEFFKKQEEETEGETGG
jgi:hypothetical protein